MNRRRAPTASTVEAVRGSRDCEDVADASSDGDEGDARDDDDDDEGIQARETVDRDSGDLVDKPEQVDSGTDAAPRPFRSAIDRAPRRPSCQNGRLWSTERRRPRTRSNGHGRPSLWLASPARRPGSPLDIGRIVSCCRTF